MKVVIVGGVAAGAGAAARLRRLDETAEIVLFERGQYISYANCGLPYHVGGVIPNRDSLVVMSPEKFKGWFNVDVRNNSEVASIDRAEKSVVVRGPAGEYVETYDKLVIATGSSPVMMPLPGADDPRVTRLWTIPDMDGILAKVNAGAKRAVVIGAGFIGLETAENLNERGLDVTIVELLDQVLPTIDKEMSTPLAQELSAAGISLRLGHKVVAFENTADALSVVLNNEERIPADLVIMSVGVKPNSEIAKTAGLELGPWGISWWMSLCARPTPTSMRLATLWKWSILYSVARRRFRLQAQRISRDALLRTIWRVARHAISEAMALLCLRWERFLPEALVTRNVGSSKWALRITRSMRTRHRVPPIILVEPCCV